MMRYFLLGTGLVMALSGCSQDHPTQMALKRLEVEQRQYNEEVPLSDLSEARLSALARDYQKYGGHLPLMLSVEYDPLSTKNNAVTASYTASRLAKTLRGYGASPIKSEILPVKDLGETTKVLISYDQYSAHAPSDCGVLPGLDNTPTDWKAVKEYGFGCSIEAGIARQISHPSDLLGTGKLGGESDGRRAGNIVETYRSGTPNDPLKGEAATE